MIDVILEFLWQVFDVVGGLFIIIVFAIVGYGLAFLPYIIGLMVVIGVISAVMYAVTGTTGWIGRRMKNNWIARRIQQKQAVKQAEQDRKDYLADREMRLDQIAERHPADRTKEEWKDAYRKGDYAAFLPENSGRAHGPLIDERLLLEEFRIGDNLRTAPGGQDRDIKLGFSFEKKGFGGPSMGRRFTEQLLEDFLAGHVTFEDMGFPSPGHTVFDTYDWDDPLFKHYNEERVIIAKKYAAESGDASRINIFLSMHEPFMARKYQDYLSKQEAKRMGAEVARWEKTKAAKSGKKVKPAVTEKVTPFPKPAEGSNIKAPL